MLSFEQHAGVIVGTILACIASSTLLAYRLLFGQSIFECKCIICSRLYRKCCRFGHFSNKLTEYLKSDSDEEEGKEKGDGKEMEKLRASIPTNGLEI